MQTETMTIGKAFTWVKGKKPSQLFDTANENFIPYLSASYFRTNKPDYYADVNDKNCVSVINDDVVLIWDGSNAGDVFQGLTGALSSTMVRFNKSEECDTKFLYFLLKNNFRNLNQQTTGSTIPHVSGTVLKNIEILITNPKKQKSIARMLTIIQEAIARQEEMIRKLKDLKQGMMRQIFTHGTRGEETKMTEIGEMPESWRAVKLGEVCGIIGSSITFSQALHKRGDNKVHGIKVSDMNIAGNEKYINKTQTEFELTDTTKLVPPNSLIFPKRGAAIATNKKRITTIFSLLDPNLIAVVSNGDLLSPFIYYYFETFDLRTLTDRGTIPQLNKKDLLPVILPVPNKSEQQNIINAFDSIESKIEITNEKLSTYQNLFKTLLHELMSGERRVKI